MSKVNHNIVAASVFSEDIKVVFVIVEEEFVIVEEEWSRTISFVLRLPQSHIPVHCTLVVRSGTYRYRLTMIIIRGGFN